MKRAATRIGSAEIGLRHLLPGRLTGPIIPPSWALDLRPKLDACAEGVRMKG